MTIIDLLTVRTAMAASCNVAVICADCGHDRDLDLGELIDRGHADTALL